MGEHILMRHLDQSCQVDFQPLERISKDSTRWYSKVIDSNGAQLNLQD